MPPALAAALIGAGVSGTEMGLQASGALTPSSPSTTTNPAAQQKSSEQQAFRAFAPNAQEQLGSGVVADPAFAALVASMTNSPGDIGLAQQTIFGNTPPAGESTAFTGAGPGLASGVAA